MRRNFVLIIFSTFRFKWSRKRRTEVYISRNSPGYNRLISLLIMSFLFFFFVCIIRVCMTDPAVSRRASNHPPCRCKWYGLWHAYPLPLFYWWSANHVNEKLSSSMPSICSANHTSLNMITHTVMIDSHVPRKIKSFGLLSTASLQIRRVNPSQISFNLEIKLLLTSLPGNSECYMLVWLGFVKR